MEDFAAGAMIRVIRAGLAAQGITLPDLPDGNRAHVPLQVKRDVLREILAKHGPEVLLKISDAIWTLPPDPVSNALILAPNVPDFMARWARLERFSHSRHRIVRQSLSPGRDQLTHVSLKGPPVPTAGETLVVIGLIAQLIGRIAPTSFQLSQAVGMVPLRRAGEWCTQPDLDTVAQGFIIEYDPAERPFDRPREDVEHNGSLIDRLRRNIALDPARTWRLPDLAEEFCLSPRTLQRRLSEADTHLSRLVEQVRLEIASDLLSESRETGLAEIGFLCGFSDQAHFNRRFKNLTGVTPGMYRRDFSV